MEPYIIMDSSFSDIEQDVYQRYAYVELEEEEVMDMEVSDISDPSESHKELGESRTDRRGIEGGTNRQQVGREVGKDNEQHEGQIGGSRSSRGGGVGGRGRGKGRSSERDSIGRVGRRVRSVRGTGSAETGKERQVRGVGRGRGTSSAETGKERQVRGVGRGRGTGSAGTSKEGQVGGVVGRGRGTGSAGTSKEGQVGGVVGQGRATGSAGTSKEGHVGGVVGRGRGTGSAGTRKEGQVGGVVGRGRGTGSAGTSKEGQIGRESICRGSEEGSEAGQVGGGNRGSRGRRGRGSRGGRRGRGSRIGQGIGRGNVGDNEVGEEGSRVEQGGSSNQGDGGEGPIEREGRGRGSGRGRGRGRGRRVGGGGHDAEVARIEGLRQDRRERLKVKVREMTREELEDLVMKQVEREPGLIIDLMSQATPPSPEHHQDIPSWCVCSHCTPKPTDRENVCCGFMPDDCLTRHGTFALIIDEANLALQRAMWQDAFNLLEPAEEPGQANKSMRHRAYRSIIFWQHGVLGRGNRRVVPSCCVDKVHERYPSPNDTYTGYIPGRFV